MRATSRKSRASPSNDAFGSTPTIPRACHDVSARARSPTAMAEAPAPSTPRRARGMSALVKTLAGKVAIVTGGASGIGRALSEELARRGCDVVVADRQSELANDVAGSIRAGGGRATAAPLDVRDLRAFLQLAASTIERTKRIDFLFNNAGIGVGGEFDLMQPEDWDDVIDVNLRGVAHGIQAVYAHMIRQGSGHIVNTASVAGLVGMPGQPSYTATKHAVVGLTKALRIEAATHGVRASVFCPGPVRTPIFTGGRYGRMRVKGLDDRAMIAMFEKLRPISADDFAKMGIDAVLANEAIIVLPRWWKMLWLLDRISPSLVMRIGARALAQMRKDIVAAGGVVERAPVTRRSNGERKHVN